VPRRLVGRDAGTGAIPRRLRPVFRDRDELPTSAELGAQLRGALEASRNLIVLCSPRAAQSRWVNEEVAAFKRLGRESRIFCLVVDGEPNAADLGRPGDECFCPALRFAPGAGGESSETRVEPVAADLRPGADGRANAFLKLLAGLLGVGYDELKQRHRQARRASMLRWTAAGALLLAAAGSGAWHLDRRRAVEANERLRAEARAAVERARPMIERGDYLAALRVAASALPAGPARSERSVEPALLLQLRRIRQAYPVAFELPRNYETTFDAARHAALAGADRAAIHDRETGAVRLWDTRRARIVATLRGPGRAPSTFVDASDDGAFITVTPAAAGEDRWTFGVWRAADGSAVTLPGLSGRPAMILFGPNGRAVAVPTGGSALHLVDLVADRALARLEAGAPIERIALSPDGGLAAAAVATDPDIRVWDTATARLRATLRGHALAASFIGFADVRTIVTVGLDRTVRVWNAGDGSERYRIGPLPEGGDRAPVRAEISVAHGLAIVHDRLARPSIFSLRGDAAQGAILARLPLLGITVNASLIDAERLFVATSDPSRTGVVRLDGGAGYELEHLAGVVKQAVLSPRHRFAALRHESRIGAESAVFGTVVDLESGLYIGTLAHAARVVAVGDAENGTGAITLRGDGTVQVWDGFRIRRARNLGLRPVEQAAFLPDGRVLATDRRRAPVPMIVEPDASLPGGDTATEVGFPIAGDGGFALSEDGSHVLAWTNGALRLGSLFALEYGRAHIRPVGRGGAPVRLPGHLGAVAKAYLSKAGARALTLAAGLGTDAVAHLSDGTTGALIRRFELGRNGTALLTRDGKFVVAIRDNGGIEETARVEIVDAATGAVRHAFDAAGAADPVVDDGGTRLALRLFGGIRIYDLAAGRPLADIAGPAGSLGFRPIAFGPHARHLVSADSVVRVYDAATGAPMGSVDLGRENGLRRATFARDGKVMLLLANDIAVLAEAPGATPLAILDMPGPAAGFDSLRDAALAPDGHSVLLVPASRPPRIVPLEAMGDADLIAWGRRVVGAAAEEDRARAEGR